MSELEDHIDKMERIWLPQLEPGQVWLVRSLATLRDPSFILIGPRPAHNEKWAQSPYDVLRTRYHVGQVPLRDNNAFAELDLMKVGNIFKDLRTDPKRSKAQWTDALFHTSKKPLIYERLFAFEAWGPHE